MERVILHSDMNNCYASIEAKLNPKLKGLPIAVCGSREDRHGIVLAKSEEAKKHGVKTGDVIWQAQIKCKDLLVLPPHYEEYLKHSRMARKIYYDYTNQIEPFGLDECWLDVSGSTHYFGDGKTIANELRHRMKKELGITVSVGISYNKIFAKLGSDLKKPDAVTEITKENFQSIVWKLPVESMLGIGRARKKKLNLIGIISLGDLANAPLSLMKNQLGKNGVTLWNFANGYDISPVMDLDYRAPVKTIGRGITCREDLINDIEVSRVFQELAFDLSKELRKLSLKAGGVKINIRDIDLLSREFQTQIPYDTQSSIVLVEKAMKLFKERYDWRKSIRSVTITAINLKSAKELVQLDLFNDYLSHMKMKRLDTTIYELRERFGKKSITFAGLLGDIKMPKFRNEIVTLPNGLSR